MNTIRVLLFALIFGAIIDQETIAAETHWLVYTDGSALYRVDYNYPEKVVMLTVPADGIMVDSPCAGATQLWYDRTEVHSTQGQRLFWTKWVNGYAVKQTTSDKWGDSWDMEPIVSSFHNCVLYQTDRTGEFLWKKATNGKQGPGYGKTLPDPFNYSPEGEAPCWATTKANANIVYLATSEGIYVWDRTHPKETRGDPDIVYSPSGKTTWVSATRLSISNDHQFLISWDGDIHYLIPGQEVVKLFSDAADGCIDAEGSKVAYSTPKYYHYNISVATIDQAGTVLSNKQLTFPLASSEGWHSHSSPTWCKDSLFFNCTKASVKFDFANQGNDSLSLSGTVLIPANAVISSAKITFGGVSGLFVPNAADKIFSLSATKNQIAAGSAKWSITFPKGSYAALLADKGLTDGNVSVTTSITLTLALSDGSISIITGKPNPDDTYNITVPVKYTARKGKSGTAVLSK